MATTPKIDIEGTAADATRMDRDLDKLEPTFRAAVERVIARMVARGLDPLIVEAWRTNARQAWLYAQGRTRKGSRVTNAKTAATSVHGYGYAVDIVSKSKLWGAPESFWKALAEDAEAEGLTAGYRWSSPHDPPHIQVGAWKGSPPPWARNLRASGQLAEVWARVSGALAAPAAAAAGGTQPLAWGAKVSPEFRTKVRAVAAEIGCDPNDLMACMAFESGGTFRPSIRNRQSGATGLIQFMPATAVLLGTTTDALAAMTAEEQLDYVGKYFRPYKGRLKSIDDLYMAILWPRAVGKEDDYVTFGGGTKAYAQNKALDGNKDGAVTKAEAAFHPRRRLAEGLQPENAA